MGFFARLDEDENIRDGLALKLAHDVAPGMAFCRISFGNDDDNRGFNRIPFDGMDEQIEYIDGFLTEGQK